MTRGRCGDCATGFDACYTCGFRDELVGELVEDFKYNSVRTLGQVLAEVLEAALPEIAGEVVVVPLPTIGRHVRERGFDHTLMVAKRLAKMRGWKCERVLARAKNTVQVGVGAKERRRQAGEAYKVVGEVRKGVTYVVLDDVWTTGASMKAGEKLLREAGAEVVLGAVLAISRR